MPLARLRCPPTAKGEAGLRPIRERLETVDDEAGSVRFRPVD